MTYLSSAAALRRVPPQTASQPLALTALLGDRSKLHAALATKRAAVASLEAAWVAAAEKEAAIGQARTVRIDDRATWDGATWDRYLSAATKYEPEYKSAIIRLLREIDNIARLLALPARNAA